MIMTAANNKDKLKDFPAATSNMRNEELEKYRQQWTVSHPHSRTIHYETESRRAANFGLPARFQVKSVRYLPGTPRPVENFRERLIAKYGILSFCVLRSAVGNGMIPNQKLLQAIKSIDIKVSYAEFNQIVAYFTAEDNINTDNFYRAVSAFAEGFDVAATEDIFLRLFGEVPDVLMEEVMAQLNGAMYPEVADGLRQYMRRAYCTYADVVTLPDFLRLHNDLHAANPEAYDAVLSDLWK